MFKPMPPIQPMPPIGPPNSLTPLNINTPLGTLSGHILKVGIITLTQLTNPQGKQLNLRSIDLGITKQIDIY